MFRPEDIDNFKMIYHLVKECGMTLDGAKRAMKDHGTEEVARNAELLERLQSVRSMLLDVREILKDGGDSVRLYEMDEESDAEANETVTESAEKSTKSPVKVIEPKQPRRKKKKDEEQRQLFAFYEQTLFQ